MVHLRCYKNSAEENRVDKTNYISLIRSFNGNFRDESSIISPIIEIELNRVPDFNYIYIQEFSRYYFVIEVESVRNGLWRLQLDIDVLMTYKDAIVNLTAFVDRNEFDFNPLLIDKRRVIEQGVDIDTYVITNNVLSTSSPTYVLNGFNLSAKEVPNTEQDI